jgi:hypothetical protein
MTCKLGHHDCDEEASARGITVDELHLRATQASYEWVPVPLPGPALDEEALRALWGAPPTGSFARGAIVAGRARNVRFVR